MVLFFLVSVLPAVESSCSFFIHKALLPLILGLLPSQASELKLCVFHVF